MPTAVIGAHLLVEPNLRLELVTRAGGDRSRVANAGLRFQAAIHAGSSVESTAARRAVAQRNAVLGAGHHFGQLRAGQPVDEIVGVSTNDAAQWGLASGQVSALTKGMR